MPTEFSVEAINDYFAHLNPIATKIASDINETRAIYEHIWNQLKPSEHNDIINETLIKPEISLRYFDNFSSNSSLSKSSSSSFSTSSKSSNASSTSLTAVLCAVAPATTTKTAVPTTPNAKLLDVEQTLDGGTTPLLSFGGESKHKKASNGFREIKSFYGYDGRNISTYAEQKVAQKIIHDDILGAYRDEHSLPFSYKTKSQINLRVFNNTDEDEVYKKLHQCQRQPQQQQQRIHNTTTTTTTTNISTNAKKDLINESESLTRATTENYKKLQMELANNLSNRIKTSPKVNVVIKPIPYTHPNNQSLQIIHNIHSDITPNNIKPIQSDSKYERFHNELTMMNDKKMDKLPPNTQQPSSTIASGQSTEINLLKLISKNTTGFLSSTSSSTSRHIINSNTNNHINSIRRICYDEYTDEQESANLMMNCSSSGLTLTSSSSAPSEEGDEYEEQSNDGKDDDEGDDDEKTLCEDVKLLLDNDGLQKGFDFLNNW